MADIHLTLVQEIEKYPLLYNNKIPDYTKKDMTEKAWMEVSNKLNLSVQECKEKWRNIRSTFLRSFKAPSSGSKPKKPYYLKEHLSFIVPFVKPLNEIQYQGNITSVPERDPFSDAETEEQARPSEDEQELSVSNEIDQDIRSEDTNSTLEEPVVTNNFRTARKRYKPSYNDEIYTAMQKYPKKSNVHQEKPKERNKNQTNMNHFFLSLMNEFDDMSDHELRTFKIKILQLIDEIKLNRPSPASLGEPFQIKMEDNY
ncbi:uncharacterized protein LOC115446549 [Manduca sexta]|uniref:Transcription factor Adf-1 n=1 Tax=Manduca sexta TaxID=7130 RepID=A0A922CQV3_MANSE|nr:uncharacterized protein LOC115446549 [Manduca sexta]KAG6454866.1 hypothetical protein O3G_MSEX008933 [Manduca sexta]